MRDINHMPDVGVDKYQRQAYKWTRGKGELPWRRWQASSRDRCLLPRTSASHLRRRAWTASPSRTAGYLQLKLATTTHQQVKIELFAERSAAGTPQWEQRGGASFAQALCGRKEASNCACALSRPCSASAAGIPDPGSGRDGVAMSGKGGTPSPVHLPPFLPPSTDLALLSQSRVLRPVLRPLPPVLPLLAAETLLRLPERRSGPLR